MFIPMLTAVGLSLAAAPHASYPRTVTANGLGVGVVTQQAEDRVFLDRFSDRLYQQRSPTDGVVRDLLYDAYFGIREGDGAGAWLTGGVVSPREGTNAIDIRRRDDSLVVTEVVVAPMTLDLPAVVMLLHVENAGAATTAPISLFALQNFHLGDGEPGSAWEAERLVWADGVLREWGDSTGLGITTLPLVAADAAGCDAVWQAVQDGEDIGPGCDATGDDQVAALQWAVGPLAPGESAIVGVVHAFTSGWSTDDAPADLRAWRGDLDPHELLDREAAWWSDWIAEGTRPAGDLTTDELRVHDQALVALKMGQVREDGAPYGQIPASLPASAPVGEFQHEWNITWVRDAAYAIEALTETGHHAEAQAALAFFVQPGKSGEYASYLGVSDYALSVCRAYGDGTEWSDWDDDGPNVELDNFGLFLWAFTEQVRASGDLEFARRHQDAVFAGVADILVETADGPTDLVTADSSIWERHWNGNQKRFTYSSLWAVRGLEGAAWLAAELGEADRAATYTARAEAVRAAIVEHLVDGDGVLAGSLEELQTGGGYLDIAAVDAFAVGVLDPRSDIAHASLDRYLSDLAVASGGGLFRNDDGDLYDRQEWIWADLRTAVALRRACRTDEAERLEGWVLDHALLNRLIIPELLHPETADYAGPAPMMGFGSGLWVLSLRDRAAAAEACASDGSDGSDGSNGGDGDGSDGGSDDTAASGADGTPDSKGCGCASGAGPLAPLPLLVGLALAVRRRRSQP